MPLNCSRFFPGVFQMIVLMCLGSWQRAGERCPRVADNTRERGNPRQDGGCDVECTRGSPRAHLAPTSTPWSCKTSTPATPATHPTRDPDAFPHDALTDAEADSMKYCSAALSLTLPGAITRVIFPRCRAVGTM